jgi:polysaccharide export outer membrane protein
MKLKQLFLLTALGGPLVAAPSSGAAEAVTTATPLAPAKATKRAPWQERFTLGPGDELKVSLYETNETRTTDVIVAPDGRMTFLEAENVMAAGLTVDELRAKLDAELGQFYRSPRTVVAPLAYRSKRIIVMGSVVNSGVYPMDRPTTVIEAVARAGGLETGVYQRGTVELADLSRSFLVRNGERVKVDFEKLFQQGDLSQNVTLDPGDYLYIGAASANEIYVLGQVGDPGVLQFASRPTVISAIAGRGGFSGKAYKSRVLVVRGSLNNPETFVVDTAAILAGKAPDFKLQQKDIVFVSVNPWLKAADVLDTAARAFVQSMTVTATSLKVGPIIKSPWIK